MQTRVSTVRCTTACLDFRSVRSLCGVWKRLRHSAIVTGVALASAMSSFRVAARPTLNNHRVAALQKYEILSPRQIKWARFRTADRVAKPVVHLDHIRPFRWVVSPGVV